MLSAEQEKHKRDTAQPISQFQSLNPIKQNKIRCQGNKYVA